MSEKLEFDDNAEVFSDTMTEEVETDIETEVEADIEVEMEEDIEEDIDGEPVDVDEMLAEIENDCPDSVESEVKEDVQEESEVGDKEKKDKKKKGKSKKSKKKSKDKKKKGIFSTLKGQLTLVVGLPVLVVGIILTVSSVSSLVSDINSVEEDGLKTAATTLQSVFDIYSAGDYVDNRGMVYKGDLRIQGQNDIVDTVAKNGGVQAELIYGTRRVLTSFKGDTGNRLEDEVEQSIFDEVSESEKGYFTTSIKVMGKSYYGYFHPLVNSDGSINAMIFIGRESAEIEGMIMSEVIKTIVISIVLMLIALLVGVKIATSISKSINKVAVSIADIADGNLTVAVDEKILKQTNEIGMIAKAAESLKDGLSDIVTNIKESVDVLTVSAAELENTSDRTNNTMMEVSKAVEEIADSAGVQANETEKATVNATDMGELIENVISNVNELQESAQVMGAAEKESSVIIEELSKSNDKTIAAVEKIAAQTEHTNVSAQKIKKAVAIITSIADETSLLSLNASIEAARAGEAGRGFAVVASEIQKLADQSNKSAGEIEKVINELVVESDRTVEIMEEVKGIVGEQEEKLNITKAKFRDVSEGIESSVRCVDNISGRMVELDIAKGGIIDIIQNLSAISEENAAATEETSASVQELDNTVGRVAEASKDLKVIAEQLDSQVGVFVVAEREILPENVEENEESENVETSDEAENVENTDSDVREDVFDGLNEAEDVEVYEETSEESFGEDYEEVNEDEMASEEIALDEQSDDMEYSFDNMEYVEEDDSREE